MTCSGGSESSDDTDNHTGTEISGPATANANSSDGNPIIGTGGYLVGHAGDDVINGSADTSVIHADSGNDIVTTGDHGVVVDAGDGNDLVTGGSGADVVFGGAGDDIIDTGSGNDKIWGGEGNDLIKSGDGDDLSGPATATTKCMAEPATTGSRSARASTLSTATAATILRLPCSRRCQWRYDRRLPSR